MGRYVLSSMQFEYLQILVFEVGARTSAPLDTQGLLQYDWVCKGTNWRTLENDYFQQWN